MNTVPATEHHQSPDDRDERLTLLLGLLAPVLMVLALAAAVGAVLWIIGVMP